LQLIAQPSGAAAVIGDSDYGRETLDPQLVVSLADETLETAK
jgi:hypothetical protein